MSALPAGPRVRDPAPVDPALVGAAETLAFLRRALPPVPGRLLEVGCGRGEVARGLLDLGWRVLAVECDAAAAAAARERGVDARDGSFPEVAEELAAAEPPFDALLFVRLLHHVPLDPCLAAVERLLRPGGLLLVEDYDWERVDRATAEWAYGLLGAFAAAGLVPGEPWEAGGDALAAWRARLSSEGLHSGATLTAALRARFDLLETGAAPYFHRYLARYLAGRPFAAEVAARVLAGERALVETGAIQPLGLRCVARRRG